MASLSGILNILTQSLSAEQGALQVTSGNIANVNTPGYSRQLALMNSMAEGPLETGVQLQPVTAVRDNLLEVRLNQETQQQGQLSGYLSQMNPIQASFNDVTGSGLSNSFNSFFANLNALATQPSNSSTRSAVLAAANTLAGNFNSLASSIVQQQQGADSRILQDVGEINTYAAQIASLNQQIGAAQGGNQDTSALVDQRTQLVRSLSGLVGVNVIDSGSGMISVATASGAALVVNGQAQTATTSGNANGLHSVLINGVDVTATGLEGDIGGLIQARDTDLTNVRSQLDTLASQFASAVNTQHQAGFDLNGNPGGQLFTFSAVSPASTLTVAFTDPTKLAASSDGTPGSSGNATALAAIANGTAVSGLSPGGYYANMVAVLGGSVDNANTQQAAGKLVLQQLKNQRSSVSGVSLDEESAHLTQYQQAYNAAAQVVSIINNLTSTTINMVQ